MYGKKQNNENEENASYRTLAENYKISIGIACQILSNARQKTSKVTNKMKNQPRNTTFEINLINNSIKKFTNGS